MAMVSLMKKTNALKFLDWLLLLAVRIKMVMESRTQKMPVQKPQENLPYKGAPIKMVMGLAMPKMNVRMFPGRKFILVAPKWINKRNKH